MSSRSRLFSLSIFGATVRFGQKRCCHPYRQKMIGLVQYQHTHDQSPLVGGMNGQERPRQQISGWLRLFSLRLDRKRRYRGVRGRPCISNPFIHLLRPRLLLLRLVGPYTASLLVLKESVKSSSHTRSYSMFQSNSRFKMLQFSTSTKSR
ncbi:hypothetical protein GGR55DRAFT_651814 [Xylaria sp. FL0064]|nr:hypothetical protein GGR55DRAFT_651814 [Xylaria sp. FL0064]